MLKKTRHLLHAFAVVAAAPLLAAAAPAPAPTRAVHKIALPGAPAAGVIMDYLALDSDRKSVV